MNLRLKAFCLCMLIVLISMSSFGKETLVFAIDLIRHGDRTPIHVLPNAPWPWAELPGQVTAQGISQEYKLGVKFRKKYIASYHLLPAHYDGKSMYVFSTPYDRTLMSAQAVLTGLYPPGTGPVLPNTKKPALPGAIQPIPIYTQPTTDNDLFITDYNPKQYKKLLADYVFIRPEWQKKTAELQAKFPVWTKATGFPVNNLQDVAALAEALYVYEYHHIALPIDLTVEDIHQIIAAGEWAWLTEYQTREVGEAVGKRLLARIVDYLQKGIDPQTTIKYVLFSAHDSTIVSVMTALHVFLTKRPGYASALNFVLFKTDDNRYRVKVSFNDQPLAVPGCDAKGCTIDQLASFSSV